MTQLPPIHVTVVSTGNLFTTVLVGTSVVVLGYILQHFIFQPYEDLRRKKQNLRSRLFMYRRIFVGKNVRDSLRREADKYTRQAMVEHEAAYFSSPFIRVMCKVMWFRLPSEKDLVEANGKIIGLVNNDGYTTEVADIYQNKSEFQEILRLLKLKLPKDANA